MSLPLKPLEVVNVGVVLSEIRIQGLGVIADAALDPCEGFTVITGETGAGKTMVVAGLGLLLGGKPDAARVRSGSDRALVEGRLQLPAAADGGAALADLHQQLDLLGAELDDDGSLIISRTVHAEGRSRAHAGGRSVPASTLAELGEPAASSAAAGSTGCMRRRGRNCAPQRTPSAVFPVARACRRT